MNRFVISDFSDHYLFGHTAGSPIRLPIKNRIFVAWIENFARARRTARTKGDAPRQPKFTRCQSRDAVSRPTPYDGLTRLYSASTSAHVH